MNCKCLECGLVFEFEDRAEWVEVYSHRDGLHEHFSGCPRCKGGFKELEECEKCRSHFDQEELHSGICINCLYENFTYETALEFFLFHGVLVDFMFEKVFESQPPESYSEKLVAELREIFLRRKTDDMICCKKDFMNLCTDYVFSGRDNCISEFADWLRQRG